MSEDPQFSPVPRATPEADEAAAFSARLILSLFFAGLAFYSADKSLFLLVIAFAGWAVVTVRLFLRFGRKASWSLIGASLALWWAWRLFDAIYIGPNEAVLV